MDGNGFLFRASAIEALQEYAWPGNIRELRNVVERLLLLVDTEVDAEAVNIALPATRSAAKSGANNQEKKEKTGPLAERVLEFERAEVLAELERSGKHISPAAKALGLERSHLYKKCQQLGIDLQSLRSSE